MTALTTNYGIAHTFFSHARSFISETVAGNIAGSPAPRLAKADRTGILPIDLIKQHHKAIKLALYGLYFLWSLSISAAGVRSESSRPGCRLQVAGEVGKP